MGMRHDVNSFLWSLCQLASEGVIRLVDFTKKRVDCESFKWIMDIANNKTDESKSKQRIEGPFLEVVSPTVPTFSIPCTSYPIPYSLFPIPYWYFLLS